MDGQTSDLEQRTETQEPALDFRRGQELDESISSLLDQVSRDDLKKVEVEVNKLAEEMQNSKKLGSKIGNYADNEWVQKFNYVLDVLEISSPYKRLCSQKKDVEKVKSEYDSLISSMKSSKEAVQNRLLESRKQRDLEFKLRDILDERLSLLDAELKNIEQNYNSLSSEHKIDQIHALREDARTKRNQYENYTEERDETNLSIIKYKKEIDSYQNALSDVDTRITLAKLFKYNEVQSTLITQAPAVETSKFTQQIAGIKIKSNSIVDKFRKSVSEYEKITKNVDGPLMTSLAREARKTSFKSETPANGHGIGLEVSRFNDNINTLVEQYKEQIKCEAAYK
jgi:CHAD domain-containing protein